MTDTHQHHLGNDSPLLNTITSQRDLSTCRFLLFCQLVVADIKAISLVYNMHIYCYVCRTSVRKRKVKHLCNLMVLITE